MAEDGQGPAHGPSPAKGPPAETKITYETVFTNAKAGMEGVDAEHVKRVVYEASKDSAHYANEQRKERANEERIERLKAQARALTDADLARHTASMDAKLAALEAGRDLTRTWLHVDMDAFFASVEELHNPSLANRPFAVGSMSMISTANYVARKSGVRSAMPGFIAVRLCPDLLFVRHDFGKYKAASEQTRAIFRDYDPAMRAASLDEASLDVTDYCARRGVTGAQLAAEIRERVQRETGLTCSVGIAPNRMLAKICSDKKKPNGQFELPAQRDAVMAFMCDLNIRKVPGVGKVTQKLLEALGICTCGQLLEQRGLVEALFTESGRTFFAHVALGLGATQHDPEPEEGEVGRRGISHERTFRALSRRQELEGMLRELAVALAGDMASEGLKGRTLTLKLKHTSFQLRTRARTLPRHISTADELYAAAHPLLLAELPCQLRLLGLRVSNFLEAPRRQPGQLSLEEALARRGAQRPQDEAQPQQPQQDGQAGASRDGDQGHGVSSGAARAEKEQAAEGGDAVVHSSQVLGEGELLELSLRDWQPGGSAGEGGRLELSLRDWQQQEQQEGRQQRGSQARVALSDWSDAETDVLDYSLPSSLAVSQATAARFEQEACATASAGGAPATAAGGPPALHMPAIRLDVMLQQAAEQLEGHPRKQGEAGEGRPQQQGPPAAAQGQQQGPPAAAQGQQQRQQQQQATQQQRAIWACGACTFENPKAAFWCEVCGTGRLGVKREAGAGADTGTATPAGSSGKHGGGVSRGGSSSKSSKRAKKAVGPSITRFVSQPQPQPYLPTKQEQQELTAGGLSAAADEEQQQTAAGPAVQQAADEAHQQGGQALPHVKEEGQEEEVWEHNQQPAGAPESPLLPGEDVMECRVCGDWVRETRLQAHEAMHGDEHLARKLQKEEDALDRLLSCTSKAAGTSAPSGGKQGSGRKRAAAGRAGSAGSRQGTLTAFAKRSKQ